MITLIKKQKIIIAYHSKKKSQRRIARDLGLNRRTVARYIKDYDRKRNQLLADQDNAPKEELISDIVATPRYDTSSRKKVKLTEEIVTRIRFYLQENEQKQKEGKCKQQRKKIDIFEALQEEGFKIGYTTICNAIRKIQKESREAYIRQEYAPGEVCEFDWGEVKLTIAGESRIFQMAVFTTNWGDYRWGELYTNQKTESFLDSHASFFETIGGVYREMVYDNSRVMVARFVGHSQKEPTEALLKLSLYYGFRFRFTHTYQAHEKGHVERSVEYLRRKIFSRRDTFASFAEARSYFQRELMRLNAQSSKNQASAEEMLQKERNYLLVLPPRYDTARITEARVGRYSTVSVDSNHYSIPDHLVGEFVLVKIYPDKILCYHQEQKIATHQRCEGRDHWQLNISHYLKTLNLKPGALKRSSALAQIKPELKAIYRKYYQGQERQFLQLLELAATHSMPKVNETIALLERIPTAVNTEKIKLILEKKDEPVPILAPSAITKQAKETVSQYSKLLGGIPA
jgi:transposase/predicted transcriptional regulator